MESEARERDLDPISDKGKKMDGWILITCKEWPFILIHTIFTLTEVSVFIYLFWQGNLKLLSEAMVLCHKAVDCSLQVWGDLLPQLKEFKYLGVLFISDGTMEREMDRQIGSNVGFVLDPGGAQSRGAAPFCRKGPVGILSGCLIGTFHWRFKGLTQLGEDPGVDQELTGRKTYPGNASESPRKRWKARQGRGILTQYRIKGRKWMEG